MKRDISTFVSLPQKTSLHISTPANIFKNVLRVYRVQTENIENYISAYIDERDLIQNLIKFRFRMFCNHQSIYKSS